MIRSDTDVLVLTAAGRLRALDAVTGTERWRRTFAAGATVTAGAAGVVVQDGDQVTTLSPSTGRQLWRRQITSAILAATDRTLTVATSRQLSALDLNDGRVLWRVRGPNPPGGLVAGAGQVIRKNAAGTVCFDAGDGTIRWRAPAAETVFASGDLTVLVYPDRLELAGAAGLGQSWSYPAGFAPPSHLQPTATGVMAFQLGRDDLWWDYR